MGNGMIGRPEAGEPLFYGLEIPEVERPAVVKQLEDALEEILLAEQKAWKDIYRSPKIIGRVSLTKEHTIQGDI